MPKPSKLIVRSPGRVNLIGEHTDYNYGLVMPAAVNKYIFLEFVDNHDKIHIISESEKDEISFPLHEIPEISTLKSWQKYLVGSIIKLQKQGYTIGNFKCLIKSEIPQGAGLSSSAALSCGFIYGIKQMYDLDISRWSIAKMAQKVEHEFLDLPCGIMDQFANMFSEKDIFQVLDCNDLHVKKIPSGRVKPTFFLCDSTIKHNLSDSEYGVRQKECEQGFRMIKSKYPQLSNFRAITFDKLENCKADLGLNLYNKIKYILEENGRVRKMADCILEDDWISAGQIMYEGQFGLRDLYDVSCPEIDHLIDLSLNQPEIAGSRMMGGGFGGCTINVAESDNLEHVFEDWTNSYHQKFGLTPKFYFFELENGTTMMRLPQ